MGHADIHTAMDRCAEAARDFVQEALQQLEGAIKAV